MNWLNSSVETIVNVISRLFGDFLRLIFPVQCPGCGGGLVEGEEEVCISCLSDIEQTHFHHQPGDNELLRRFAGKVNIDHAAAMFYFDKEGKMQRIIKALKYENSPQVGRSLGRIYGEMLVGSPLLEGYDALAPVPLHRRRIIERGYNQSEEFCKGLAQSTGLRLLPNTLRRAKATRSQTRKGREERWKNMQSVFEVHQPFEGGLLLADDVVTTGATLEACLRTLGAAEIRPQKIGVLSLAMTRTHS
jgi:ComF family protein